MTQAEAAQRILAKIDLPIGTPEPKTFILQFVVLTLLSFFAQKCLNWWWPDRTKPPGWIADRMLRRLVRKACYRAETLPEADQLHIDGADIYREYGAAIREAAIAAGLEAMPGEWMRFVATLPKPTS